MSTRDLTEPPAYERKILDRLGRLYLERTPQPRLNRAPLTIWEFYRFSRYIRSEGYGEATTGQASPSQPATRPMPRDRSD